jgi:hypothetical protein
MARNFRERIRMADMRVPYRGVALRSTVSVSAWEQTG